MNLLKAPMISTIQTLTARGWSERRISEELGIHRKTVRRYAKCTTPSPGSEAVCDCLDLATVSARKDKRWIFEEVIKKDDEFAHDRSKSDFSGLAARTQSLVVGA